MTQTKNNLMTITFKKYLNNIIKGFRRIYDFSNEVCYFPELNEVVSLYSISNGLKVYTHYITTKESFVERETYRASDSWREFTQKLKRKYKYTCQESKFTMSMVKQLSHDIFGLSEDETWINNSLTTHHIDGSCDYACEDETKLMVINRAIHMTLHNYDALVKDLPCLKNNYVLWFELGSLVHLNHNKYPWQEITKRNKENEGNKNEVLY